MERVRFHQGFHQVSWTRLPQQKPGETLCTEGEAGRAVSGTRAMSAPGLFGPNFT